MENEERSRVDSKVDNSGDSSVMNSEWAKLRKKMNYKCVATHLIPDEFVRVLLALNGV